MYVTRPTYSSLLAGSLLAGLAALAVMPAVLRGQTNFCTLVAPADAATELHATTAALTGDTATTSTAGSPIKFKSCDFATPGAIPNTLRLGFRITPSADVAHQGFQMENQTFGQGSHSPVSGVGDEAMLYPDGELLIFRKHAVYVVVQGGGDQLKFKDTSDRLRAFATKLAAKLP